jgi:competence protein ComEC
MKAVGLTHIVVASGYNLTVLVGFARRIFEKHAKMLATGFSAVMMGGFVMISGLSPSMSRAALVSGLGLLAWHYGRTVHPVVLLTLAAAATATVYPVYVWADVGWYLSFLAFTGVLVIAPILSRILWKEAEPRPLVQVVVETLSAEIMTMPVILCVFGYVPLVGLLANVLVGPTIPFAMAATAIVGGVGIVSPVAAALIGPPAQAVLWYAVSIVRWLASYQLTLVGQLPLWGAIAMYVVIGIGATVAWRRWAVGKQRQLTLYE